MGSHADAGHRGRANLALEPVSEGDPQIQDRLGEDLSERNQRIRMSLEHLAPEDAIEGEHDDQHVPLVAGLAAGDLQERIDLGGPLVEKERDLVTNRACFTRSPPSRPRIALISAATVRSWNG